MTYNRGPFYLTTLTFPHPMFVHRNACDKHPPTLAGIMTSTSRGLEDHDYLAENLKRKGICSLTYELIEKLLWKRALRRYSQFMELLQVTLISISDVLTMSKQTY